MFWFSIRLILVVEKLFFWGGGQPMLTKMPMLPNSWPRSHHLNLIFKSSKEMDSQLSQLERVAVQGQPSLKCQRTRDVIVRGSSLMIYIMIPFPIHWGIWRLGFQGLLRHPDQSFSPDAHVDITKGPRADLLRDLSFSGLEDQFGGWPNQRKWWISSSSLHLGSNFGPR